MGWKFNIAKETPYFFHMRCDVFSCAIGCQTMVPEPWRGSQASPTRPRILIAPSFCTSYHRFRWWFGLNLEGEVALPREPSVQHSFALRSTLHHETPAGYESLFRTGFTGNMSPPAHVRPQSQGLGVGGDANRAGSSNSPNKGLHLGPGAPCPSGAAQREVAGAAGTQRFIAILLSKFLMIGSAGRNYFVGF